MDGLESTRRIRELEASLQTANPGEPRLHQYIVGLSANSDQDTMLCANQAGIDDFLEKPLTVKHFRNVVTVISQKQRHDSLTIAQ